MIGIYGGTFDPVHYGHLRTALELKEIFDLDQLRLIPCAQPAHRSSPLSSPEMRFQMLTLAVKNQPDLIVDRRELEREGPSYMVDTLRSLRAENSHTGLMLFMGTDAFQGIMNWYQWQALFDYAHIVVITRPGYQLPVLSGVLAEKKIQSVDELKKTLAGYLFFQSVTQLDISASKIRQQIEKDGNPGYLLPDCVISYIEKNTLYKNNN